MWKSQASKQVYSQMPARREALHGAAPKMLGAGRRLFVLALPPPFLP
jgi:hypothetical protein